MENFGRMVAGLPENLGDDWRAGFQKLAALLPEGITPFQSNTFVHLLVVPDGFLSMMPLELAPSSTGEALIEHHELSYLPSAVLLLARSVAAKPHYRAAMAEPISRLR